MNRLAAALLLALAAAAGLLLAALPPPALQRFWLDRQLRAAGPAEAPAGVLVVDVDEASLAALRAQGLSWPLPRDVYALLAEALREAGARAIVIDLVLDDARPGDAAPARTLAREGAPVLLAAAGVPPLRPPADDAAPPPWASLILPHAGFGLPLRSPRVGLVSQMLDADGRLRQWRLWHEAPGVRLPLMPLAVLQALGEAPPGVGEAPLALLLGAPPLQRPLAPLLEAAREGQRERLAEARGRIVFIGASGSLADSVLSPWGQRQGTALLAGATAALREGRWLHPLPLPALLALGGLGLLPGLALLRRGGRAQPAAALGWGLLAALLLAAAFTLLSLGAWRFDPSPALLALALLLGGELLLRLLQQRREAERLQQAQALARAGQQAKVALLGAVSDELRTPLSAVLGLAELLQQEGPAETRGRRARLLGRAAERLGALVDDLLDFNRLELGAERAQPQTFELAALLAEAVALAQARRGHERVLIDLLPAPDLPPWLRGDATRLRQVLAALLTNALAYTPVGRVSLRVQRGEAPDSLQFIVSDTGIGIAPSQLARLFDAQADATLPPEGGGSLSLAAARQRVRLLGGEIEAASVPGAGSRFAFTLPLPACAAPPPRERPEVPLAGRHLLLAEDDELAAEVLAAQLEGLGLRVERAGNGHLAVALALRLPFDWLLLDLHLAGLDGLAVLRRLRRHEAGEGSLRTPVLVLAAEDNETLQQACREAGADALLRKPVTQAQLLAALQRSAAAEPAASQPREALATPLPQTEAARQQAHALVFLGHWGSRWAGADPAQREALRADLLDCATRIDDGALAAAARGASDARLNDAVEAALARLRGLSS